MSGGANEERAEMANKRLTDDEAETIARRYREGDTIAQIMADMSVSRATVYYTLDKLRIPRDRQPRAEIPESLGESPEQTLAWAMRKLLEQEREIGSLREQLDQRARTIDYLAERLQATVRVNEVLDQLKGGDSPE